MKNKKTMAPLVCILLITGLFSLIGVPIVLLIIDVGLIVKSIFIPGAVILGLYILSKAEFYSVFPKNFA